MARRLVCSGPTGWSDRGNFRLPSTFPFEGKMAPRNWSRSYRARTAYTRDPARNPSLSDAPSSLLPFFSSAEGKARSFGGNSISPGGADRYRLLRPNENIVAVNTRSAGLVARFTDYRVCAYANFSLLNHSRSGSRDPC